MPHKPPEEYPWPADPADREEARLLQERLALCVRLTPLASPPRRIAGADAAYSRDGSTAYGAAVVLEPDGWTLVDQAWAASPVPYPYVPGLLAFREGPCLLEALGRLGTLPDLVFFNGHGILHPRGLGLASHLGLLLRIPSIGCAQGPPAQEFRETPALPAERGSHAFLCLGGSRARGVLLRTRRGRKPLFVSPGHLVTLEEALHWTLAACVRYRMPEPLRQAHLLANRIRRASGPDNGRPAIS